MKVLVYPKDKNPYQDLLYAHQNIDVEITYLRNPTKSHILGLMLLPIQLFRYRLLGYKVFHLHWVYPFQLTHYNPVFHTTPFKMFFSIYFIYFLISIKLFGYKLVWTVHDLTPHGHQFINDLIISKILAHLSNAMIVHSRQTITSLNKLRIPTNRTFVVPIGNYINIYPNLINMKDSRKLLSVSDKCFAFGFFGRIEYYKGVIDLINVFLDLPVNHNQLIIAGPCPDENLKNEIYELCKNKKNITLNLNYISDEEMQVYLNSVNICVYPFKKITTSSSVILAMSFKKPVIAPLIGDISDLPRSTGYYYKSSEGLEGLSRLMNKASNESEETIAKGEIAFQYAKELDWRSIFAQTCTIYNSLIHAF